MEYVLDIETEVFEKIKNHETLHLKVPAMIQGIELKKYDTLKLYHPGEEIEALRVEVVDIRDSGENNSEIELNLLEWMFRMETELDVLLEEEKKWEEIL